ncbi:MAG: hypothetical protein ACI9T9_000832 [Oleiphilaceae bacterium]|jgi:hypothetical protein
MKTIIACGAGTGDLFLPDDLEKFLEAYNRD